MNFSLVPSLYVRVCGLFATHFFGFGLFLPFFPIVLDMRGLDAAQIGFLLGLGTIARIVASPALSNLSDRTGQRRMAIFLYSCASVLFLALFLLPGGAVLLSVAVLGYMIFNSPVVPLSDAYALDVQRNEGSDYARMRLWGSAGFVIANLLGGSISQGELNTFLVPAILAACLSTGLVAITLPRQVRDSRNEKKQLSIGSAPFGMFWFWLVIVVLGLNQASHAALYGFGTLYWQSKGISEFSIGSLWAIGVVAEIALFIFAGKLAKRFDPPVFLIVAGVAASLRWVLFPVAESFSQIAMLQLLHACSFGAAHLGAVAILAKVVPSRWAGTGQGLLATSTGIQMAIGLGLCGVLYDLNSDWPFYSMAFVSFLGTALMIFLTPIVRARLS